MKRPKYLEHMDAVREALDDLEWANMEELMAHTKLTYSQVHMATVRLRNRGTITSERIGSRLVFFPASLTA